MVFMILTRSGFDAIKPRVIAGEDAVWLNANLLTRIEVKELTDADWNVSTWTNPLTDLSAEIGTVQLHHPNQIVWMEAGAETDAG